MPHVIISRPLTQQGPCKAPHDFGLEWDLTNPTDTDQEYTWTLTVEDERPGSRRVLGEVSGVIHAGDTRGIAWGDKAEAPGRVTYTLTLDSGETSSVEVICTAEPEVPFV